MENTSTQLTKLGSVVIVCTAFRKGMHLISFKKIAKIIGSQEVRIDRPLMAKVLRMTSSVCSSRIGLSTRYLNHFSPWKSSKEKGLGGR